LDPSLSGSDKLAALLQNTQTTADSARADMVKANTQITSQALTTLGTILKPPDISGGSGSKGGSKKSGSDSSGDGGDSSGGSDGGGGASTGDIISAVLPLIIAAFA
jgi:uncharacterized membrane protein YgcG